jgi:hypothetical protein
MWESIVAVAGTLLGVLATGQVQRQADGRTQAVERRREQLAAVTALVAALADHRRAMWVREEARLSGADTAAALRADSHVTRSAVTTPHVTVAVLLPELRAAADAAVEATYAMRNAADPDALSAARASALNASEALVAAAGRHFA